MGLRGLLYEATLKKCRARI
ncbi:hypothetical protein SEVIR_5G158550v4 [Setaria viridis]